MAYPFNIKGDYTDQPAVFKMNFGKKFFIWKGKSLTHAVETTCKDIDRFLRKGIPPGNMLENVLHHIQNSTGKARILTCQVDVLVQTDDVAELLRVEKLTLEKFCGTNLCLNMTCDQHIPKWIQEELNKAISGHVAVSDVSTHRIQGKNTVAVPENKPQSKSALMLALAKAAKAKKG